MDIADLVASFSERFGVLFRPASPTEVSAAESAGVPDTLLEFYREYEPNESGEGEIRFFALERVVAQMTDFVPGSYLACHGYFGIAETHHGDVFFVRPGRCRDYTRMPVYLFSHEINFGRMSAPQIEEFGTTVASGIPDFLFRAVSDRLKADAGEA
jgi:hypothetical protein